MNALVIDLTHGGLIIAMELAKSGLFNEIWAWDIYQTTSPKQKDVFCNEGIRLINNQLTEVQDLVEVDDLKLFISSNNPDFNINSDLKLISPVHCPLNIKPDFTHHQIIKLILKNFNKSKGDLNQYSKFSSSKLSLKKIKNIVIEVTGVKGKTSSMGMLKEIFAPYRTLILSSLGAEIFENNKVKKESIILKKNISIAPASIIETVKLAEDYDYGPCIFETSLGATGMADVGLITNIIEDYPIAQNKSTASAAKEQIFQSNMVCCEYDTFYKYYPHFKDNLKDKINLFSFNGSNSNLYIQNVKYGLKSTFIEIKAHNLKTIHGNILNSEFSIETFAPSPYQVQNVLAAVSCALTAGLSPSTIKEGLQNFSGLEGRSSLKIRGETVIIEEINPGINVSAIENAINMIIHHENSMVILGGQYGITCEEIDEFKTAQLLEKIFYENKNSKLKDEKEPILLLTHELGNGIKNKMKSQVDYVFDPHEALDQAINIGVKNVVFIYRSNYSNLELR